MIRKTFVCLTILSVFVFTGCAELINTSTTSETEEEIKSTETFKGLNAWKGTHISVAIRQLGTVDNIVSDETEGKIYMWVEYYQVSVPQYSYESVPRSYEPAPLNNSVQIPHITRPQSTVTQGEMRWNPYLGKWEWKSQTRTESTPFSNIRRSVIQGQANQSRSFSDILVNSPAQSTAFQKRLVTKYVRQEKRREFMLYVGPNGIIYDWNSRKVGPNGTTYPFRELKKREVENQRIQRELTEDYYQQKESEYENNRKKNHKLSKYEEIQLILNPQPKSEKSEKERQEIEKMKRELFPSDVD